MSCHVCALTFESLDRETSLLRPCGGAKYCNQFVHLSVCLSVCVSVCLHLCEHISGTTGPIFTKLVVQIPCGRGSVFLWRRCDMLCNSGFMDDVMFGRSGPYGDAWLAALQYCGGVWYLWLPCFSLCKYNFTIFRSSSYVKVIASSQDST